MEKLPEDVIFGPSKISSLMKIDNSQTQTAETQQDITPALALDLLKQGNARFRAQQPLARDFAQQVAATATGQYPFAVVLSCIDSRVPAEIVFDQGIGDIFSACVAGNFVNEDILGSMEFACKVAGVKLVVVLGHTSCGAIKGACDDVQLGNLTNLLAKLKPAVDAVQTADGEDRSSANTDFVNRVATENVHATIREIRSASPVIQEMETAGTIAIVPAMYSVANGEVTFLEN